MAYFKIEQDCYIQHITISIKITSWNCNKNRVCQHFPNMSNYSFVSGIPIKVFRVSRSKIWYDIWPEKKHDWWPELVWYFLFQRKPPRPEKILVNVITKSLTGNLLYWRRLITAFQTWSMFSPSLDISSTLFTSRSQVENQVEAEKIFLTNFCRPLDVLKT